MRLFNRRPDSEYERRIQLLKNASFVAFESRKFANLKKWLGKHSDNRLIFVYDTDVIITYTAPWMQGPIDDRFGSGGYGQIMPARPFSYFEKSENSEEESAAERRLAEAVGWMLGSKAIALAFQQDDPPYQLEAHDLETKNIYSLVKHNAEGVAGDLEHSRNARSAFLINRSLALLTAELRSGDGMSFVSSNPGAYLLNILSSIQRNDFGGKRLLRQWDAYMSLQSKSKGIFRLNEYVDPKNFGINGGNPRADLLFKSPDPAIIEQLTQTFSGILLEKRRLFLDQLFKDAKALAELCHWNGKLAAEGNSRYRVVLITGDRNLILRLSDSNEILVNTGRTVSDFADESILHLWSLVDQIGEAIQPKGPSSGSAYHSEWLNMFLGFLALPDDAKGSPVRRLLLRGISVDDDEKASSLRADDVEAADKKWRQFARLAVSEQAHFNDNPELIRRMVPLILKKLHDLSEDPTMDRDRMLKVVRESLARARDRSNVVFSDLGASAILAAHQNGVRNPPDLMFDSQKHTNNFFKDLARPKRVFQTIDDFSQRFHEINKDCHLADLSSFDDDDRQESYLKYLVLGALFASANRWMVAEQHAASALNIVKRARDLRLPIKTKDGRNNISGREAYFLLSVSRRVRAERESDFEIAGEWLRSAWTCLKSDREVGARSVPYVRFECEKLALALSRYYFERVRRPHDPQHALAYRVFEATRALCDLISIREDEKLSEADSADPLPASTQVNIATNLLQVFVIWSSRAKTSDDQSQLPIPSEVLTTCLNVIAGNTDYSRRLVEIGALNNVDDHSDAHEVICSPLILRYTATAARLLRSKMVWGPTTPRDIDLLFDSEILGNVTTYDETRYKMLEDFLRGL